MNTIRSRKILTAVVAIAASVVLTGSVMGSASAQASTQNQKHTVVKGEYLDKIARKYDTTWQRLYQKNLNIQNPNLIYVGQALVIPKKGEALAPRGQKPVAKPAPKKTVNKSVRKPVTQRKAPVKRKTLPAAGPSRGTDCNYARQLINKYPWNKTVAYNVMVQESSCNPNAANMGDYHSYAGCRGSYGLFQINCGHGVMTDPEANVEKAYQMWKAEGWKPWSFTTCKKVACY